MSTTWDEVPGRIVGTQSEARSMTKAFTVDRAAAAALLAAGILFIAGSVADYVILWLINRQSGPQWEFAAVTTTVEGMSRIVLGIALLFGGLHLRGKPARWSTRLLGVGLILIAVSSVALAGLMALDFLALRNLVRPEAIPTFRATTAKTLFLCAVYIITTLTAGIISVRSPGPKR
jgi:hypothetical protein